MKRAITTLTSMLVVAILAMSLATPAFAASKAGATAKNDTLIVKIAATGATPWGKITLTYKAKGKTHKSMCHKKKCTFKTPKGTSLTLSQKATDILWPFKDWTIQNGKSKKKTTKSATIHLKISGGKAVVEAVYQEKI